MKILIMTLTIVILFITCLPAYGGDNSVNATYNAGTGDATFDTTLGDLNVQTKGKNLSEFISNLSLSYNIPRIKIEDLLFKVKMTPADVYIAVGLSKITEKPVDELYEIAFPEFGEEEQYQEDSKEFDVKVPRSRKRKVTIFELTEALKRAIEVEERREERRKSALPRMT